MSAIVNGFSTCNEDEDEVIWETLLEADSLLNDRSVIPDMLPEDKIVGQESQQESQDDRSAVDTDRNNSFPALEETIGTVIPESIPAVRHGSPHRSPNHLLAPSVADAFLFFLVPVPSPVVAALSIAATSTLLLVVSMLLLASP
jgi:hypothetical protein